MANLFVMIGISGSGKSTYAKKLLEELKAAGAEGIIISSDAIRGEICNGDQTDQSRNKQVFETAHRRIDESLSLGVNVIWDATNLSREERAHPLAIARKHKVEAIAIELRTPLTVSIERNRFRERVVPTPVIWKQQGRYFPATKQEFSKIMTVELDRVNTF